MKRCAWFLTDLRIGGGERLPLVLLPELPGWEGLVILLKDDIEHEMPPGVRVVPLGPADAALRSRALTLVPAALRASRDADLLVGGLEGAPIIVAALVGWLTHRSTVGVVPTHLGRHLEAVRMSAIERGVLGWALRRCRAVITASADGGDALIQAGVRSERIHVIPNPVTPWAFTVVRSSVSNRPVSRLLTVGRLEPVKGMDVILEAASKLRDVSFEWEIVGDGTQAAALRARNVELGLEGRVRFAGRVEDLTPCFERAHCFVLASRLEGMSIAMLEAMATGLPIVATRSGLGVEEALDEGRAGVLVPAGDPDALASAVRDIVEHPDRAQALGEAARRRARDFAPATIATAYARVFDAAARG